MLDISLSNLDHVFPSDFNEEEVAKAKTILLKKLSEISHEFYNGKIQILPKAGIFGFNWFNVWYTPGVSRISTLIRDDADKSFELSNRGNLVAVVSDSTRVLGDGDVGPAGGLGVMEGKAFLMKYLGGIDAFPLCIDSRNKEGKNDPQKIIDFVKMAQHSFGAINLEDISQPNCFEVLDRLRDECDIPVWHDDAQGTACVTLAGLFSALKVAGKEISKIKVVMLGAGASNTTIAKFIIDSGADPSRMIIFDSKGSLNKNRSDIEADKRFYKKWELCKMTNVLQINEIEEAVKDSDVLIALSTPGPDTVKPDWITKMNSKAIVFACANPVPEIYPYAAKKAGAYIVATGRGDFPNQVNNSLGFPGILKGALMVRSRKITDLMAIRAAVSLSDYAEKKGLTPDNIIPTMEDIDIFPRVAADVALQAIKDGMARVFFSEHDLLKRAYDDIKLARDITDNLIEKEFIRTPPASLMKKALNYSIEEIKKSR